MPGRPAPWFLLVPISGSRIPASRPAPVFPLLTLHPLPCRVFVPRPAARCPAPPGVRASARPMALQALQSSGVAFRKILSHFPEELSLAFAYGSGVYRQAGPSSNQKVSPARSQPHAEHRPVRMAFLSPFIPPGALEPPARSAPSASQPAEYKLRGKVLLPSWTTARAWFLGQVASPLPSRAGDAVLWRKKLVQRQDGREEMFASCQLSVLLNLG